MNVFERLQNDMKRFHQPRTKFKILSTVIKRHQKMHQSVSQGCQVPTT